MSYPDDANFAIVIPCFGHSNLVREAINSALTQDCERFVPIIFVNDGCKSAETDFDGRLFAQLYPGRFFYLRNENRGLGGARNAAVEFALRTFKNLRYFFFLDADNKLLPGFLTRSIAQIDQNPEVDVFYFSMLNLGSPFYFDNSGTYSFAEHVSKNPIDAGSWVSADVFRDGHRYYTNKALGFEDWQLFLTIGASGGKLLYIDNPGFFYRRRPESMVNESESGNVDVGVRQDLKKYITHDNVVHDEHVNIPRYALWDVSQDRVRYFSDPRKAEATPPVSRSKAVRDVMASYVEMRRAHAPSFQIFACGNLMSPLSASKLDYAFLLSIERLLESERYFGICGSFTATADGELGFDNDPLPAGGRIDFVAIKKQFLQDCVADLSKRQWFVEMVKNRFLDNPAFININIPEYIELPLELTQKKNGDLQEYFLSVFLEMSDMWDREPVQKRFDFKDMFIFNRNFSEYAVKNALGYGPVIPRYRIGNDKNVVIVLPFCDYGGVEKIALNFARLIKSAGHYVTLLLTHKRTAHIPPVFHDSIDEVIFLEDEMGGAWDPTPKYFGTNFSAFIDYGNPSNLMGSLSGADVVFNFHAGELHGVMRKMRQAGAITIAALQVIDIDRHGNWGGYPYQTVGYEHVYDKIIAPSTNLMDWCCSHGIPREKLRLIPNGPGVPIDADDARVAIEARQDRAVDSKMRVLFMGRFDYQKGIDVLLEVIAKTAQIEEISWKVIGSSVLDGDPFVAETIRQHGIDIEAPKRTREDLLDALANCDCLVLPSRYEGVPLTIIEAMTMGCTVIATDVGGTREFVESGTDCYLLAPGPGLSDDIVELLIMLSRDQELRNGIGIRASQTALKYAWHESFESISDLLQKA